MWARDHPEVGAREIRSLLGQEANDQLPYGDHPDESDVREPGHPDAPPSE